MVHFEGIGIQNSCSCGDNGELRLSTIAGGEFLTGGRASVVMYSGVNPRTMCLIK